MDHTALGGALRNFALNHMTAANASFEDLLVLAKECGCSGVELRNDLSSPLFGGVEPQAAAAAAASKELRLLALAEVKSFNHLTSQTVAETEKHAALASACGAEAIALIPANDGSRTEQQYRKKDLQLALTELIPILKGHGMTGLVEPLGFITSSLRYKQEVVEIIEQLCATDSVKLVHDTFHHFLSGETRFFPQHTGMVHISGVVSPDLSADQMHDSHRVLVNNEDRLQNIQQLSALTEGGYCGPISVEAFATEVHQSRNLAEQLQYSFQFINSGLAARVA